MMFFHNLADRFREYIVLSKVNGGGGAHPTLNAPTITLEGSIINITDSPNNGNFTSRYDVYCNGNKFLETTSSTVDIESVTGLPTGTDTFTVKCVGYGFNDSSASNSVTYSVINYFITSDNKNFVTSDDKVFISA